MKYLMTLLSVAVILASCTKDEIVINNVDSITAHWHFTTNGDENGLGRGIAFGLTDTVKRERQYQLIFDWHISDRDIIIELVGAVDKGDCTKFPIKDGNCASGRIFIPENLLTPGDYNLVLRTKKFEVQSVFNFDNIKYSLLIPTNSHFNSPIDEVFPIPKNILYGSVVIKGTGNIQPAKDFINELNSKGFSNIIVPNFDKIQVLNVDMNGLPIERTWQDENYSFGLVCSMNHNFRQAYDIAIEYFNENDLNIYIYSSNGDVARLSKTEGISTLFVE